MLEKITFKLVFLFAVATIILIAYYLMQSAINSQNKNFPTNINYNPRIYQDTYGRLKYAEGSCSQNSDCVVAGCSNHICSSNSDIVTTCELGEDFPNTETFDCGCYSEKCVWTKK